MFTFAAAEGYMIRNGRLAEPVSDVTLTGMCFRAQRILTIGLMAPFILTVAERWSRRFTVSDGPHLRIKNVVVGGR
jgi:TldD protein